MEIFNEQIGLRMAHNRKVLQQARDKMNTLVNGEEEKQKGGFDEGITMNRRLPDHSLSLKDLMRFVLQCLDWKDIVYILFLCLAVTLIGMYTPYVTKQIYDEVIPSGTQSDLLPILGLLLGAGIGGSLFGITRQLMLMYLRYKVDANLQAAVMARTFNLKTTFFRQYAAGDLSNRVLAINEISHELSDTLLSDLLTVLFSVGFFIQIFHYAPSLFGLSLLIMLANLLVMVLLYFWHVKLNSTYIPRQSALSGMELSVISGIQKIKTSGSELRAFARVSEKYCESIPSVDKNYPVRFGTPLIGFISSAGTLLIYLSGYASHVPISDFIAYMAAFGAASGAMATMSSILPKIAHLKPLIQLARPLLEAESESGEEAPKAETLLGKIEIHDLSFRYSPETPYIFNHLNLTINPGEYVALVGKSGCGKSTLIRLLLGFETPETGSIFYDSYDLSRTHKQSIRQQIGTCLQDGQIFAGTILENITVTHPNATEAEVWDAARIAAFDDDINDMPMGLRTLLSENSGSLSGGQRQRLLIARAVLCKPSILFMDEATSALDNIKQKHVSDSLEELHCTRISIAHRLSTIMHCDRIIVLDKGAVAEEGTFDELMAQKGLFYDLCQRQL